MNNIILSTDSYKASQWVQYPPNTMRISSYVEARGSKIGGLKDTVFFGLQVYLQDYLSKPITKEMIDEAESYLVPHGEPFNREGWEYIVNNHGGYLPLVIEAVPEGMVMPTNNVQVQVTNTNLECPWLTSYIETSLLRGVWYPSTVASVSRYAKTLIADALEKTSDVPVGDQIGFKLHDFGARGVSSGESAMLGGMGHLVNFMGTDTVEALVGARKYYEEDVAGFSIPASEHSTITSWGKGGELEAYRNMIMQFAGEGKIYACVSDSYNIYEACDKLWPSLKEEMLAKGGTLVVRPDSGDPLTEPVKVIEILMDRFGYTVNSKGYKVLPDFIRVIQGDGITVDSLPVIIGNMIDAGFSLENLAFGMGGGLLQQIDRDTFKYAMKCSACQSHDGQWYDVFKDPVGGGKTSKKGRLGLVDVDGRIKTVSKDTADRMGNILQPVYVDGEILKTYSLAEVRSNAWK